VGRITNPINRDKTQSLVPERKRRTRTKRKNEGQ